MCDFDVDICLLPRFWLKALPLHVANRLLVEAQPSLELVILRHFEDFEGTSTMLQFVLTDFLLIHKRKGREDR